MHRTLANMTPALSCTCSGVKDVLGAPSPSRSQQEAGGPSPCREYYTYLPKMCPPPMACGRETIWELELDPTRKSFSHPKRRCCRGNEGTIWGPSCFCRFYHIPYCPVLWLSYVCFLCSKTKNFPKTGPSLLGSLPEHFVKAKTNAECL